MTTNLFFPFKVGDVVWNMYVKFKGIVVEAAWQASDERYIPTKNPFTTLFYMRKTRCKLISRKMMAT